MFVFDTALYGYNVAIHEATNISATVQCPKIFSTSNVVASEVNSWKDCQEPPSFVFSNSSIYRTKIIKSNKITVTNSRHIMLDIGEVSNLNISNSVIENLYGINITHNEDLDSVKSPMIWSNFSSMYTKTMTLNRAVTVYNSSLPISVSMWQAYQWQYSVLKIHL